MKLPSTITTVTGKTPHASLRRCAAAIGGRAPLVITRLMCGAPRSPAGSCVLAGELLLALGIQVTAVTVVEHDGRERLDLESPDGLRPEVLVGDDLQRLDVAREHGAGAADGPEVHALELAQRVLHGLPPVALARRAFEPELEQGRGELVHPAGRGGADGPGDVARLGRGRAGVVDDGTPDVDGQRLALLDQRQQPPVRGVAGRVDHAGEADTIARLQGLDVGVAERRPDLLDAVDSGRDAHQAMASTMALKVALGRIAFDTRSGFGR